ncbi:MAG TPA: hypothetical protein VNH15_04755 [Elusimicrobiota bacterium]|nr:hypothetical protein [Elusimicrobiota bacterium]
MKTAPHAKPLAFALSFAVSAGFFAIPARGNDGDSAENAKQHSGIPFGESVGPAGHQSSGSVVSARSFARAARKAKVALAAAKISAIRKVSQDVPFGSEDDQIQDKHGYVNACGRDIAEGFKSGAKEGAVAVGALGLIVGGVVGSGAGPLGTIGGAVAGAATGGLLGGLLVGAAGAAGSALICANDYIHTR